MNADWSHQSVRTPASTRTEGIPALNILVTFSPSTIIMNENIKIQIYLKLKLIDNGEGRGKIVVAATVPTVVVVLAVAIAVFVGRKYVQAKVRPHHLISNI